MKASLVIYLYIVLCGGIALAGASMPTPIKSHAAGSQSTFLLSNGNTIGCEPSLFTPNVPTGDDATQSGLDAHLLYVGEACVALDTTVAGKIAIVARGGCSFAPKVAHVQQAGAIAVVVINNNNEGMTTVIQMIGDGMTPANATTIPACMINKRDGNTIENALLDEAAGPIRGKLTYQGSITVTQPGNRYYDVWKHGEVMEVTWTSNDIGAEVLIDALHGPIGIDYDNAERELAFEPEVFVLNNGTSVPNSGSYTFKIPETWKSDTYWSIRLTDVENSGTYGVSSKYFTVKGAGSRWIKVLEPGTEDTSAPKGEAQVIKWASSDFCAPTWRSSGPKPFELGDKVEVNWQSYGTYYTARVIGVNKATSTPSYDVQYVDDNSIEREVMLHNIRAHGGAVSYPHPLHTYTESPCEQFHDPSTSEPWAVAPIGRVHIDLYLERHRVRRLATVDNTGEWAWTVDPRLESGDSYSIQIKSEDESVVAMEADYLVDISTGQMRMTSPLPTKDEKMILNPGDPFDVHFYVEGARDLLNGGFKAELCGNGRVGDKDLKCQLIKKAFYTAPIGPLNKWYGPLGWRMNWFDVPTIHGVSYTIKVSSLLDPSVFVQGGHLTHGRSWSATGDDDYDRKDPNFAGYFTLNQAGPGVVKFMPDGEPPVTDWTAGATHTVGPFLARDVSNVAIKLCRVNYDRTIACTELTPTGGLNLTTSPLSAGLRRVQATPAPTAATAAPTATALGLATEAPTHSYDPPTPGPTVSPERRAAFANLTFCDQMTSFQEKTATCMKAVRTSEAFEAANVTNTSLFSEYPNELHTDVCQCYGELEEAAEETNHCFESLFEGDAAGPVPEDALKATLEHLATWKRNVCEHMQCSGRIAMCPSADPSSSTPANSSAVGRRMEGEQGHEDMWMYDVVVPVDQEAFNQYYLEIIGDDGKHDRGVGVFRIRRMGSPSVRPTPQPTTVPTDSPSAGIKWVNECMNGFFDEGETAIDCGGGECPKCQAGRGCKIGHGARDCVSGFCIFDPAKPESASGICDTPTPTVSPTVSPTESPTTRNLHPLASVQLPPTTEEPQKDLKMLHIIYGIGGVVVVLCLLLCLRFAFLKWCRHDAPCQVKALGLAMLLWGSCDCAMDIVALAELAPRFAPAGAACMGAALLVSACCLGVFLYDTKTLGLVDEAKVRQYSWEHALVAFMGLTNIDALQFMAWRSDAFCGFPTRKLSYLTVLPFLAENVPQIAIQVANALHVGQFSWVSIVSIAFSISALVIKVFRISIRNSFTHAVTPEAYTVVVTPYGDGAAEDEGAAPTPPSKGPAASWLVRDVSMGAKDANANDDDENSVSSSLSSHPSSDAGSGGSPDGRAPGAAVVEWRANPVAGEPLAGKFRTWTQHADALGRTYYYDSATEKSSWVHPAWSTQSRPGRVQPTGALIEADPEEEEEEETHDSSPEEETEDSSPDVSVEQEQEAEDTYDDSPDVLPITEV